MELFDTSMVGLQMAMYGANLRQEVLANNVANANTPGFKRSDVDFHAALEQAFAGSPTPQSLEQLSFQPTPDQSAGSEQVDGNNVDIDAEMADLSQNTLDYESMASVMSTRMQILKTAIGTT